MVTILFTDLKSTISFKDNPLQAQPLILIYIKPNFGKDYSPPYLRWNNMWNMQGKIFNYEFIMPIR